LIILVVIVIVIVIMTLTLTVRLTLRIRDKTYMTIHSEFVAGPHYRLGKPY